MRKARGRAKVHKGTSQKFGVPTPALVCCGRVQEPPGQEPNIGGWVYELGGHHKLRLLHLVVDMVAWIPHAVHAALLQKESQPDNSSETSRVAHGWMHSASPIGGLLLPCVPFLAARLSLRFALLSSASSSPKPARGPRRVCVVVLLGF